MNLRSMTAVFCVCCVASITALGQAPSPARNQGLVLEISIVEMISPQPNELERLRSSRDHLNQLMNEGRARLTARLEVRTRIGEAFSARVGQRVPIQSAIFPVFRTSGEGRRGASQANPSDIASFPQLVYESIGLSVDGSLIAVDDSTFDIRLNLEMSGLDTSTGRLTPTFLTRSLKNVVRMKQGETAIPVGLIQQEQPAPTSANRDTTGGTPMSIESGGLSRGSFIVLLTTKPVQ